MNRIFLVPWLVIALIGCTNNLQVEQSDYTTATAEINVITPTARESGWAVYDPDPDHLWNRVFRQFFRRTTKDGKEYGSDELDPLLWFDTTYLLNGNSHQQALLVLDEFLTTNAENLVRDPLKRAMFQRDMWAVFDWLSFQPDPYPLQREALQSGLAQVIKRIALTREEILSLPDSYQLAVESNAFPPNFQEEQPQDAFLPSDLFQENSAWVPMGREGGPIAMAHTEGFPFLGRSVFLVFVRSPDGRTATLDFIHSLNTERRPVLATGSGVALVRRMLLIDDQGNLVLSPLVETVQIRHFNLQRIFHEFELDRARLLKGYADAFRLKTGLIMLFFSHGDVFEISDLPTPYAAIPDICRACHVNVPAVYDRGNIQGILSYSRANFPLPDNQQPILRATSWEDEAQTVIQWKLNHVTWQSFEALWH
jgi:hypothetical protein